VRWRQKRPRLKGAAPAGADVLTNPVRFKIAPQSLDTAGVAERASGRDCAAAPCGGVPPRFEMRLHDRDPSSVDAATQQDVTEPSSGVTTPALLRPRLIEHDERTRWLMRGRLASAAVHAAVLAWVLLWPQPMHGSPQRPAARLITQLGAPSWG